MRSVTSVKHCAHCYQEFFVTTQNPGQWYCSRQCWRESLVKPLAERFWGKVATGPFNECWPWEGAVFETGGYGLFWNDGKNCRANRVAWEQMQGPIPEGFNVIADCANVLCCNPDHLALRNRRHD